MTRKSAYGFIWPLISTYEDWNTPSEIVSTHFRSGSKRGAQKFWNAHFYNYRAIFAIVNLNTQKRRRNLHISCSSPYIHEFFWECTCCSLKIFRLALVKGQLISKGHFGFFNSPKKRTKNFSPGSLEQKFEFSSSFFGRIEVTKKIFRN